MIGKLKIFALMMSICLLSCSSSSSDDSGDNSGGDVKISCSQTSIKAPANGGSYSVAVVASTGGWTAAADENSGNWVKVSAKNTNKASGMISVNVDENTSKEARNGAVNVKLGSKQVSISVTQAGKTVTPIEGGEMVIPEGYKLVWNDEFNEGSELNSTDWRHEVQKSGWVNNELQNYVNGSADGKRVTEIADNRLYINCFKGMPCNNDFGANPWPKCGEIDIMEEVGVNPNYTSSSLHTEKFNHVMGTQITKERLTAGAEDGFHVYRLEWTPDYIKTYVDGKELLKFNNDGKNDVSSWPFNKPFYVILNLAWGGDWGGMKGVDESALPVQMEVDYVRVFQKK